MREFETQREWYLNFGEFWKRWNEEWKDIWEKISDTNRDDKTDNIAFSAVVLSPFEDRDLKNGRIKWKVGGRQEFLAWNFERGTRARLVRAPQKEESEIRGR